MLPQTIKMALVDMLENLSKRNFEKFCHQLLDRREGARVSLNRVEGKSRLEIVDVLVSTFTEPGAAEVSAEILRQINCNNEAEQLERRLEEVRHPALTGNTRRVCAHPGHEQCRTGLYELSSKNIVRRWTSAEVNLKDKSIFSTLS